MNATVTRLPAPPAVGLRDAAQRFTGRDRFEPTTVAAYREQMSDPAATIDKASDWTSPPSSGRAN